MHNAKEVTMKSMRSFSRNFFAAAVAGFMSLTAGAHASQVQLNLNAGNLFLLSDRKQTVPIKVGLTGIPMPMTRYRAPVNVAIVLDKSGSMTGEKIRRAREAAIMAVNLLDSRDIVSVVAYDDTARIVVPATPVANRYAITRAIEGIMPGGSTALFAGVSLGAREVERHLDSGRVNRVILLSDGLANVGPSSPGALGDLGASFKRDGISVTTIGLGAGYNEDLMFELAGRSDGNHAFAENARDLSRIFQNEFGDILSVVAQDIEIRITCQEGVRPVRVLGRDADIYGQTVVTSLNQLYSNQEKYVLLEVEVPPYPSGSTMELARVDISYADMNTRTLDSLSGSVDISFTDSKRHVERHVQKETMVDYVTQSSNIEKEKVIRLRDAGKKGEAKALLRKKAQTLKAEAAQYQSDELEDMAQSLESEAEALDRENWGTQRKKLKESQYKVSRQQKW
jgi:Ca-activated chloride channel family protein